MAIEILIPELQPISINASHPRLSDTAIDLSQERGLLVLPPWKYLEHEMAIENLISELQPICINASHPRITGRIETMNKIKSQKTNYWHVFCLTIKVFILWFFSIFIEIATRKKKQKIIWLKQVGRNRTSMMQIKV